MLALCVVFAGCKDDACDVCGQDPCICAATNPAALSSTAAAVLAGMGVNPNSIIVPQGATFYKHYYASATSTIALFWVGASQSMFDTYDAAWKSKPKVTGAVRAANDIGEYTQFDSCELEFFSTAGSWNETVEYPAGTILLQGTKSTQIGID